MIDLLRQLEQGLRRLKEELQLLGTKPHTTSSKNVKSMLEAEGVKNVLSGEPKTIEHGIESYNSFEGYKEGIKKNGIYAIGVMPLI